MSVGKRYDASEPLTEHDIAARLDKAAERVFRIMLDARQLGLAEQITHSRYLTHPTLGILRAELDAWGVAPAPFDGQLDPLTPDAQAVADAYSRWLSSYQPTGAPMSEQQSTEQNPAETVSTTVETEGATVSVDDGTADADAADGGDRGDDASGSGDTSSDGSAEDGGNAAE